MIIESDRGVSCSYSSLGLASATVAKRTSSWGAYIVNIVRTAVPNFNVIKPVAAVAVPVKADLSGDFTISHRRM